MKPAWLCKEMKEIKKYQEKLDKGYIHGNFLFDEVKSETFDIWLLDTHTFYKADTSNINCKDTFNKEVDNVKMHMYKSKLTSIIYVGFINHYNGDLYLTEYNKKYVRFVDFETYIMLHNMDTKEAKYKKLYFKLGKDKFTAMKELMDAINA